MAGINMSGDLRAPSKDIPNGSLAAICTGTFLYLTFILFLGSTCRRDALLTDFMMTAKVSVIRKSPYSVNKYISVKTLILAIKILNLF